VNRVKEQQLREAKPKDEAPLKDEVNSQMRKLLLAVLVIFRVTVTFMLAIFTDYLIIKVISWTFDGAVSSNPFTAYLLEGIQILSALGTALAYILFLIRALFRDLRETRETFREEKNEK
jgi:hypothetical protein